MRERPGALLELERVDRTRISRQADWKPAYTASSVAVDVAAVLFAIALAAQLRFDGALPAGYLSGSLALTPVWVALVATSRAYEHRFIGVGTSEFDRVLRAGLTLMALVAFVSYATKAEFARGYVIVAIPTLVLFSILGRVGQRSWLHRQRVHGRCVQRTILVGSPHGVRWTAQRLLRDTGQGLAVVGACIPGDVGDTTDLGVPVGNKIEDLESLVLETGAEMITVLSNAHLTGDELRRLAWRLETTRVELIVCSGLTEIVGSRITIRPTAHSPMLQITRPRLAGPSRMVKGLFDRASALLGLILISPLLMGVTAAIWASDRRNPFFSQKRVGINGREFKIYKFRTMVPNAEALKAELATQNESDGVLFKITRDPRITRVGRSLRRYSIDELPQLINVVRGEMSLVGPRPPLPQEVSKYDEDMRRRLLVKPGLTGLWQVSGRSDLTWAESELLDLRYVENWSLGFDLLILWRTARAVFGGSGAY